MRPIYIENCTLVLRQVVLIAKGVLISSGLYNGILLYVVTCLFAHVRGMRKKQYESQLNVFCHIQIQNLKQSSSNLYQMYLCGSSYFDYIINNILRIETR